MTRRSAPRRPTPAALAELLRRDPALRPWLAAQPYPGFPAPGRSRNESHFAALARSILFQQLATAAARTIHRRVRALTPGPRFPRPEQLLALGRDPDAGPLRRAGVSAPKQRSLLDLAARVLDGRLVLASVTRLDDETIIERLLTVRGIGTWSAQMFLIFRLGRLDVMPAGDLGLQRGLQRLDGLAERPTPTEVLARAPAWTPLRTVASWALWRAADDG